MLLPEKVQKVQELLVLGGLSQRQIAKRTGISRATIGEIAKGRRLPIQRTPAHNVKPPLFSGPTTRCKTCGAKVRMPCFTCGLRGVIADDP